MTTRRRKERALIVIGKAPRAGQVKTRLTPPLTPRRAAKLYTCFLRDSVALARAVEGTDVVLLYIPRPGSAAKLREVLGERVRLLPQKGNGIGEGTAYAFSTLLGESYKQVVLIGSDNPTLPPSHIIEAYAALDRSDVVLGPVDDGGYYLIGMSQPHVGIFENVSWSTELVEGQIRANAERLGLSIHTVPQWFDVDTVAELQRVVDQVISDPDHPAVNTRRQIMAWIESGILKPREGIQPPRHRLSLARGGTKV